MGPEVGCGALVPPPAHNSQMFPSSYSYQLAQRTFHTFDFYKKHQDAMTPAGLAFFQCRWDDSVTHIFHQLLGKGQGGGWSEHTDLPWHARSACQGMASRRAIPGWAGWTVPQSRQADRRVQASSSPHPGLSFTLPADMREPVFEFVRPPPYHPKQKCFPHQQPLRYLDRYRVSQEPTYGIY